MARDSSEVRPCLCRCDCGTTSVRIRIDDEPNHNGVTRQSMIPTRAFDCHCACCRSYHVSAFASYLQLPRDRLWIQREERRNNNRNHEEFGGPIKTFRDHCRQLGPVDRLACRFCGTKLVSRPIDKASTVLYVNMGSLLSLKGAETWITGDFRHREATQTQERVAWRQARPAPRDSPSRCTLDGSCKCGKYAFQIQNHRFPTELQHCYCRKCRHLSGAAFMTWMPARALTWTASEPPLVRTTPYGRRHMCDTCGSNLSIVYDRQPDMIWPAVGSLANLPSEGSHYYRIIHICCDYRPDWYELPDDGLPRVGGAS